jgi:hypothetical protein
MLSKLNSLWKNLLIVILGGLLLAGSIIFNILNNLHEPNFVLIFGIMGFLFLYGLFLVALFIRNLIDKNYFKAFGFILVTVVLNVGLWISYWVVVAFLIGAASPDYYMKL